MVADYIFEKDKLFANLNLSDESRCTSGSLNISAASYHPNLVIYLQTSPRVLRTRLARKGVPEEQAISPADTWSRWPRPTSIISSTTPPAIC